MSSEFDNEGESDRDLDEGPQYAYWIPDDAIRNLTFERQMHSNETTYQLSKRLLEENLPLTIMGMVHLAINCKDERTRLTAQKYIIDYTMGVAKTGTGNELPEGKEPWTNVYSSVLVQRDQGL